MIDNTAKVAIGGDCFFNNDCSINSMGLIIIGEHCLFGENVKLYDHNHRYSDYEKNIDEQGYTVGTISLGSNCWIGSNVTILMNSHIGDHVIIGANCLIHKDIPSNSIVKNSLNSQVGVREINYTN